MRNGGALSWHLLRPRLAVAAALGFFSQIARLALDRGPLDAESIRDALTFVDTRQDCADFTVAGLLRILYQFGANPLLSADLRAAIGRSLLGFKYWIDEPGRELMCFWSENHQIMFHAAEYLAGQLFPDDVFANSGTLGREHMASARSKILRWIALKARVGFAEWDSNTYYDEDMTPLLNLADFAADHEVAQQATMLLDVMFFDMVVDSFRGVYGTSHGRSYPHNVLDGRTSAMAGVQKIAWGMGVFNNPNSMTAVSLAASPRYRVPPIVEAIAQDMPAVLINRERHSLRIEDCARYGINIDDPDGLMLLWGAGLFAERRTADATLALADRYHSHRFSVVIRPYAEAVRATYAELARQSISNDGDLDRTTMTQVDKITYRTPDLPAIVRAGLPQRQAGLPATHLAGDPRPRRDCLHHAPRQRGRAELQVLGGPLPHALPSTTTCSSPSTISQNDRFLVPRRSCLRRPAATRCPRPRRQRKSCCPTPWPSFVARCSTR